MMDLSRSPRIQTLMASIDALPAPNAKIIVALGAFVAIVGTCLGMMAFHHGTDINVPVVEILLGSTLALAGIAAVSKDRADARNCDPSIKAQP